MTKKRATEPRDNIEEYTSILEDVTGVIESARERGSGTGTS